MYFAKPSAIQTCKVIRVFLNLDNSLTIFSIDLPTFPQILDDNTIESSAVSLSGAAIDPIGFVACNAHFRIQHGIGWQPGLASIDA